MYGLTIRELLLMALIHQPTPIGPDDRFPVDRLTALAALHGLAQRLEVPGVAEAVTVALREQLAAPSHRVAV